MLKYTNSLNLSIFVCTFVQGCSLRVVQKMSSQPQAHVRTDRRVRDVFCVTFFPIISSSIIWSECALAVSIIKDFALVTILSQRK